MLAVIVFSDAGKILANELSRFTNIKIYTKDSSPSNKKTDFQTIWDQHEAILFISATGIAVRYIAPYISKKDKDPAVMVMDDRGAYVISLLSGHLGGANALAETIGHYMDASPVITTASDNRGFTSIDVFAKENDYEIEDLTSIIPIASDMVNGKRVGLLCKNPIKIDYPYVDYFRQIEEIANVSSVIVISESESIYWPHDIPYTMLRPKIFNLGIGARKDAPYSSLKKLLTYSLNQLNISKHSIKAIGSIDLKKEEPAIQELSKQLDRPFYTFTAEELSAFEKYCHGSKFVKDTVGVCSVSCTAALRLGGRLIVDKRAQDGFTISITREE